MRWVRLRSYPRPNTIPLTRICSNSSKPARAPASSPSDGEAAHVSPVAKGALLRSPVAVDADIRERSTDAGNGAIFDATLRAEELNAEPQWNVVLRGAAYGGQTTRGGRTRGVAQGGFAHGSADVDVHISDDTEGSRIDCTIKVYYAAQFHALRRLYLHDAGHEHNEELPKEARFEDISNSEAAVRCSEQCYLESLSRCTSWAATGGKTKARFFKTQDGRFVVKSVSPEEIDMLHACAPKYFDYLAENAKNVGYDAAYSRACAFSLGAC